MSCNEISKDWEDYRDLITQERSKLNILKMEYYRLTSISKIINKNLEIKELLFIIDNKIEKKKSFILESETKILSLEQSLKIIMKIQTHKKLENIKLLYSFQKGKFNILCSISATIRKYLKLEIPKGYEPFLDFTCI